MHIKIRCPRCDRKLRIRREYAGRKTQCPDCGFAAEVPLELFQQAADAEVAASVQSSGTDSDSEFLLPPVGTGRSDDARGRERASPPPPPPPAPPPLPRRPVHSPRPVPPVASAPQTWLPYVPVPGIRNAGLSNIPDLTLFTQLAPHEHVLRSYRIRIKKPRLLLFFLIGLVFPIPIWGVLVMVPLHFLRKKGHTFLYLTDQRVIVVELLESMIGRTQTVLNFGLETVSGFALRTQHGIKRFLNLFTLREKRAFYIQISTRTFATYALGSENAISSDFSPGMDAVTLCSELDACVLDAKSSALSH